MRQSCHYGEWVEKNLHYVQTDFWKRVLFGDIEGIDAISREALDRNIPIKTDGLYCLVYSKLRNTDADVIQLGKKVFESAIEGFHAELLTGKADHEALVHFLDDNILCIVTVCDGENAGDLSKRAERLIETCNEHFRCMMTCCVGRPGGIDALHSSREEIENVLRYNIGNYGKAFLIDDTLNSNLDPIHIFDIKRLVDLVDRKEKTKILQYLKSVLNELNSKNINSSTLHLIKGEIMQAVYANLTKQGIQATKLFYDPVSLRMSEKATETTVDLVRWVNYLLSKTYEYEEEVCKSHTIIEKVDEYIRKHFNENIDRGVIAANFFLTPEYLARLYKRKTGINIKDRVNEYRIEYAKELLRIGEHNVSEIAEACGFNNFSYFSTLFKKATGISPKNFKE
jgi:two-component system response regulator YesN